MNTSPEIINPTLSAYDMERIRARAIEYGWTVEQFKNMAAIAFCDCDDNDDLESKRPITRLTE
jgi:hypothetical protein